MDINHQQEIFFYISLHSAAHQYRKNKIKSTRFKNQKKETIASPPNHLSNTKCVTLCQLSMKTTCCEIFGKKGCFVSVKFYIRCLSRKGLSTSLPQAADLVGTNPPATATWTVSDEYDFMTRIFVSSRLNFIYFKKICRADLSLEGAWCCEIVECS